MNKLPEEQKWRWLQECGIMRYAGRDIIKILLDDGTLQPFYRSSGRNSGMPGTWFPFDGILPYPRWFIKDRFTNQFTKYKPLERFGTEFYKSISQALGLMNIPEAKVETIYDCSDSINEWLGKKKLVVVQKACVKEAIAA